MGISELQMTTCRRQTDDDPLLRLARPRGEIGGASRILWSLVDVIFKNMITDLLLSAWKTYIFFNPLVLEDDPLPG